jgi:hypothetical protein
MKRLIYLLRLLAVLLLAVVLVPWWLVYVSVALASALMESIAAFVERIDIYFPRPYEALRGVKRCWRIAIRGEEGPPGPTPS